MTETKSLPPKLNKNDPCLLCGRFGGRVRSHIFPQFVSRYLRETSATGYIRMSAAPNKRVQAGPWDYLLCQRCEALISPWETRFAKKVFRPILEGQKRVIRYGRWLPMFATSVTWRVLAFHKAHPEIGHKVIEDWSVTDAADTVWRECLLGQRPHPGKFEQHLVPFGYIVGTTRQLSPNLNRYLMRSFDSDVMSNGEEIIVYAKLLNFMFFGLINFENPKAWCGTKLAFSSGVLSERDVTIPAFIMDDFLMEKAISVGRAMESQSERQQIRIAEAWRRDPDRVARSGTFKAFEHDFQLSGDAVFRPAKKDD